MRKMRLTRLAAHAPVPVSGHAMRYRKGKCEADARSQIETGRQQPGIHLADQYLGDRRADAKEGGRKQGRQWAYLGCYPGHDTTTRQIAKRGQFGVNSRRPL